MAETTSREGEVTIPTKNREDEAAVQRVREQYARIAERGGLEDDRGGCRDGANCQNVRFHRFLPKSLRSMSRHLGGAS